MTHRLVLACAFAGAVTVLSAQEPRQIFRSGTDVVMVDVSVRSGGRVVAGLTAADFVLTDNGVRQQIEAVDATAVPIDVTLVVDLSGNGRRPWRDPTAPSKISSAVEREVGEVTKILRPTDRVRLLTIDRYVRQVWPLRPVSALPPIGRLEFDGLASVYDGLAAALLQPVEPARRHVVVARTKGVDTISAVSADAVGAIASRSDALFHIVLMEMALDTEAEFSNVQCNGVSGEGVHVPGIGLCWPTNRSWRPHRRMLIDESNFHRVQPDGLAIKTGADATGGGWHQAELLHEPSLTGTFKETFENFRSSYVLRYTPRSVTRGGWHAIQVTVPKSKSYEISARRGYGIEERPPAPPPVIVPSTTVLRTADELAAGYDRGAYQQVVTSLRQVVDPVRLIQDFEEGGNPWPGAPHREAAFMLDLVEPAWFSPKPAARDEAMRLIQRFSKLVRPPLEPDAFEREWHYTMLTMLQGAIRPAVTEAFIDRALERFPKEPRFLLLRAINTDQRTLSAGARLSALQAPGTPRQALADVVEEQYTAAMAFQETAAEAHLRFGWFLYNSRRPGALAHLRAAGGLPMPEPAVRYLQQLLLGKALIAEKQVDEAIAAFRGALAAMPGTQSARVALMHALLSRGDRAEAEALADQVETSTGAVFDPWWMYLQGQYRLHPQALARLREMAR